MTTIEQEAEEFVSRLDSVAREKRQYAYVCRQRDGLIDRLRFHRDACFGSLEWFSDGQKALAKLGQSSDAYDKAIKNGQECLEELDRLISALEAAP